MFKTVFLAFFMLTSVLALPLAFDDGLDPKNIHAVLVSGVPCDTDCWLNYAPEAEVAQTYHFLLDHGVPAENIILFMNGLADNANVNPFPGKLFTDKNFTRDYNKGLKIDYKGDEVNSENFLAVIRGEKDKVNGGSGRVLNSNENNRVFISHEGHGGPGILVMNTDYVSAKDYQEAFAHMNHKKMFKELVFYVMACYSGSIFNNILDKNGNIYAMTAADPNHLTDSKDEVDAKGKHLAINTQFGSAWLTDSETHDTKKETLNEQYEVVKPKVDSFPSQWGNLNIAKEKLANFEGNTKTLKDLSDFVEETEKSKYRIPIAPHANYVLLKQKIEEATFEEKDQLVEELNRMEKERNAIKASADSIAKSLNMKSIDQPPESINQLDCHDDIVKFMNKKCKNIRQNQFFNDFFTPIVNLCEQQVESQQIIAQMSKFCSN